MESVRSLTERDNNFYRDHYYQFIIGIMVVTLLIMIAVGVMLYQIFHKPLPKFYAQQSDGQKMELTSFAEPNLLPDTILQWASKAATAAYTFDFANYNKQLAQAKPFFTDAGWRDYLRSVEGLINNIVQNQLFVNSVVAGTPVISNQGPLPGQGYVWRIQIPFLVTYNAANVPSKRRYFVVLSIVRVSTNINPQGIGIDQFVMV